MVVSIKEISELTDSELLTEMERAADNGKIKRVGLLNEERIRRLDLGAI